MASIKALLRELAGERIHEGERGHRDPDEGGKPDDDVAIALREVRAVAALLDRIRVVEAPGCARTLLHASLDLACVANRLQQSQAVAA